MRGDPLCLSRLSCPFYADFSLPHSLFILFYCQSCSHVGDKEKLNIEGWVVAEEAVIAQFEESLQESVHKDYFS